MEFRFLVQISFHIKKSKTAERKEKKSKLLKMQTSSDFLPHTVVVLEILAETEDRVIKRSFKTQAS